MTCKTFLSSFAYQYCRHKYIRTNCCGSHKVYCLNKQGGYRNGRSTQNSQQQQQRQRRRQQQQQQRRKERERGDKEDEKEEEKALTSDSSWKSWKLFSQKKPKKQIICCCCCYYYWIMCQCPSSSLLLVRPFQRPHQRSVKRLLEKSAAFQGWRIPNGKREKY